MLRPSMRRSAAALLVALIATHASLITLAYSSATSDVSVRDVDSAEDDLASVSGFSRRLQAVRCHPCDLLLSRNRIASHRMVSETVSMYIFSSLGTYQCMQICRHHLSVGCSC